MPLTVMRARTMSVREAEGALSNLRSPEATRRLHAAQEEDMIIRSALSRSRPDRTPPSR
jgi:hypothetical protein